MESKHKLKKLMVITMSFFVLSHTFSAEKSSKEAEKKSTEAQAEQEVADSTVRQIHKHSIGFGLGQTFLLGKFEKYGDNKITPDFFYNYTASYSFDLLIGAHFSNHSYKNKTIDLRGYSMSIKARAWEFDSFSPFLLGGLGFYMPSISKDNVSSDQKWTFGVNAGAGVDLRLNNKIIVGLLVHYHKPFEVKQDDIENVSGSYLKLLMTAMYLFK